MSVLKSYRKFRCLVLILATVLVAGVAYANEGNDALCDGYGQMLDVIHGAQRDCSAYGDCDTWEILANDINCEMDALGCWGTQAQ